jgi:hypothetical protein
MNATRTTRTRIRVSRPARNAFSRLVVRARASGTTDVHINKFIRLAQINRTLQRNRRLYVEQDRLISELLPLFIQSTGNQIVINREITIGDRRFRLTPGFLEPTRGIKATTWKSTAFKNFIIESE